MIGTSRLWFCGFALFPFVAIVAGIKAHCPCLFPIVTGATVFSVRYLLHGDLGRTRFHLENGVVARVALVMNAVFPVREHGGGGALSRCIALFALEGNVS